MEMAPIVDGCKSRFAATVPCCGELCKTREDLLRGTIDVNGAQDVCFVRNNDEEEGTLKARELLAVNDSSTQMMGINLSFLIVVVFYHGGCCRGAWTTDDGLDAGVVVVYHT